MFVLDWILERMHLNEDDEYSEDDGYSEDEQIIDYAPRHSGSAESRAAKRGCRASSGWEVCMIRPDSFDECQEAAGCLLAGRVVILDLTKLGQGPAQRIIDFVSGTVYAINGDLKQISQDIFIAAPAGTDLTGGFEDFMKLEVQDTSWRGGIRMLKTA